MKTTVLSIAVALLFIAPSLISCGSGRPTVHYGSGKGGGNHKKRNCNNKQVRRIRSSDIQGVPALWPSILTMPDLMPTQTSLGPLPNGNS